MKTDYVLRIFSPIRICSDFHVHQINLLAANDLNVKKHKEFFYNELVIKYFDRDVHDFTKVFRLCF